MLVSVTGAFALGGPLISAGSQVTIVYSTFAKNRARREKAEAARAAARCSEASATVRDADPGVEPGSGDVPSAAGRGSRWPAGRLAGRAVRRGMSDIAHKIYVAATAIRIDGSPAARSIAANVITLLAHYADDLTAGN